MNGTLQGRLVNELRLAGVTTLAQANHYLAQRYLTRHNERFSRPPAHPEPAFVPIDRVDLEMAFAIEYTRTVAKDNTVHIHNRTLQVDPQPGRASCAGLRVTVRRHHSGQYSLWKDWRLFGCYDPDGNPLTVEQALGGALASGYALRSRAA